MSTSLLELDIVDGENMLSLIGQLVDHARGVIDVVPFKLKVRFPGFTRLEGGVHHAEHEIDIRVYGVTMHIGTTAECNFEGYLLYEEDSLPDWLRSAFDRHGSMNAIDGQYDAHKRKGFLRFASM